MVVGAFCLGLFIFRRCRAANVWHGFRLVKRNRNASIVCLETLAKLFLHQQQRHRLQFDISWLGLRNGRSTVVELRWVWHRTALSFYLYYEVFVAFDAINSFLLQIRVQFVHCWYRRVGGRGLVSLVLHSFYFTSSKAFNKRCHCVCELFGSVKSH